MGGACHIRVSPIYGSGSLRPNNEKGRSNRLCLDGVVVRRCYLAIALCVGLLTASIGFADSPTLVFEQAENSSLDKDGAYNRSFIQSMIVVAYGNLSDAIEGT